jgi:hypothetical protein
MWRDVVTMSRHLRAAYRCVCVCACVRVSEICCMLLTEASKCVCKWKEATLRMQALSLLRVC